MAGRFRISAAAAGLLIASLAPASSLANSLNISAGTHIPVRPHVSLNSTLNMDVRPRTFLDIDLSGNCRADERIGKKGKRDWRCRKDR